MIQKCTTACWIKQIFEHIGEDVLFSPYLFNNLETYGLNNPNVEVWVDLENASIKAVFLRYFSSLHIFSREKDITGKVRDAMNGLLGFLPHVIMVGTLDDTQFKDNVDKRYDFEIEDIWRKEQRKSITSRFAVDMACRDDFAEIATLMMSDSLYRAIYINENDALTQLLERFDKGYGKCFVIRIDKQIVASCGISALNSKFGVIGSIMVADKYRRQGLGQVVCNSAWNSIIDENKYVIDMVATYNKSSEQFHSANCFEKVGKICKFKIKKEGLKI